MIGSKYCRTKLYVYDIEICIGVEELKRVIHVINAAQWEIVSVTQNKEIYTVFFRRPAR